MHTTLLCCCLLIFAAGLDAFYLPGVPMKEYKGGDKVPIQVNKITSIHTQLPYKYYDLEYCRPNTLHDKRENLGEILRGDKIEDSLYEVNNFIIRVYCG